MKLSQQAWSLSTNIIEAIKAHPFNKELMHGTLPLDTFAYYIEQDTLYLQDFTRCHAIIASKISHEYIRCFLSYADSTATAEQDTIHHYFSQALNFKKIGSLTPATLSYTSHILQLCATQSAEIGVAAILPCLWVYSEIGSYMEKYSKPDNPYARWIEVYSSDSFKVTVNEVITIFDDLAAKTTAAVQQQMLDAFYKSTCWEWHFWNDAYNKTAFDAIALPF